LLDPFFITKDEYSYTVKQNIKSDDSHFRTKGKAKSYEKSLNYYANFKQALQKIAKLQADTDNYSSLEEYINNYIKISTNIKNYTDGVRSVI